MYEQQDMRQYVESLHSENNELFREMQTYADQENVPIMETESMDVMLQILAVHGSKSILEIGTAIGYSALRMADALREAQIVSLEKNRDSYEKALYFRDKSDLSQYTTFYHTDALDESFALDTSQQYDVLFIDAAKGRYMDFFEQYSPYIKPNGLIISDNVFFKGWTATPEEAPKRIRPMIDKIRYYNAWLADHPLFQTRFLTVGDGLAVSVKQAEKIEKNQ
ncbi:O-methyltransferase [Salibacterium salarium]|uniref:tRNA 5-hydroxyuridine methyltransferase n=1 Tax=Salibacterium salarium TaxID=284579 RepID=A0A428MZJ3_9BACI|nr:O-methyltransferase [Salibacterium salarium]RSL31581.1 O-methyltransferase [Salibacterium salarium]